MTAEPEPGASSEPEKKPRRPPKKPPRDVNKAAPSERVTTTTKTEKGPPESDEEQVARLERERDDAALRRFKDKWTFIACAALLTVSVLACLIAILMPGTPPERSRWAEQLFVMIVSGALSYFVGKARGEVETRD